MFYKNYKCWDVDEKVFPISGNLENKIKFLLNFAILAPSSHNTQPWKFKIKGNELKLYADFSRYLPVSDKDYRMIYVSLGCALANIKVATEYFNLNYEVVFTENAIKIIFETPTPDVKHRGLARLFSAVKKRRTNRNFYKAISVSEEYLSEFKKINNYSEIAVDFVSDTAKKEKISEIMGQGMKKIMSQKLFRRELADWLRTNLTLKHDGMPGNGHGMNLFISIIAPHILRNIDVSEVEREKAIKRVLNFPALGIISSKEDNALNFIQTGEILEKLCLAIKLKEIDIAIMVAIIEDKESRAKLQDILNSPYFPQMFFGFGYAEKPAPKSPRRNLQEFLSD